VGVARWGLRREDSDTYRASVDSCGCECQSFLCSTLHNEPMVVRRHFDLFNLSTAILCRSTVHVGLDGHVWLGGGSSRADPLSLSLLRRCLSNQSSLTHSLLSSSSVETGVRHIPGRGIC
jgi:hypothetical protein